MPASTSSWQRRSYSSAEPSHQWIESGWVSSAISSTQLSSFGVLGRGVGRRDVRYRSLVQITLPIGLRMDDVLTLRGTGDVFQLPEAAWRHWPCAQSPTSTALGRASPDRFPRRSCASSSTSHAGSSSWPGSRSPSTASARPPPRRGRPRERIGGPTVIKSQVLTGGRMKAGGVKFADTPEEAEAHAAEILELEIGGHMPRRRPGRPQGRGRAGVLRGGRSGTGARSGR